MSLRSPPPGLKCWLPCTELGTNLLFWAPYHLEYPILGLDESGVTY